VGREADAGQADGKNEHTKYHREDEERLKISRNFHNLKFEESPLRAFQSPGSSCNITHDDLVVSETPNPAKAKFNVGR
jgi:hypothetical protein